MTSKTRSDEKKLIHLAQLQGNSVAFAELVKKHQANVRSFLLRLCKNYDVADDLAQETFVTAFEKLRSYQGTGSFAGWLFRIGYNCFLQRMRRNKRYQQVVAEYGDIIQSNNSRYESISAEQIDLEQAMLKLSVSESAAISLCHSYGFSHSEVAAILNTPLGTVKSNIKRGKEKLKELLLGDSKGKKGRIKKPMEKAS